MIIWVWDADGNDAAMSGVSGTESEAREAVEWCITEKGASFGSIEQAVVRFDALVTFHDRSGYGWCASRARPGSAIRWEPFRRPARELPA